MNTVLLSASVPDRDPWRQNADPMVVREAVLALVAVWIPRGELVFGGHPAISPLVEHAARSLGHVDRVHIYQSSWFENEIPDVAKAFKNFHFTPSGNTRDASLTIMRREMIRSPQNPRDFHAAVFIGGMEGIDEEFRIFTDAHPNAKLVPVGSTGAAARRLWEQRIGLAGGPDRDALASETRYRELFRSVL